MELSDAGLREQPFCVHGEPITAVAYAARTEALDFLTATYAHEHGLGLFQGPPLSGKTTILKDFTASLEEETAFAVVDGAGVETPVLLQDILGQFGYELQFDSVNELLNMLKVFIRHQAGAGRPPLLIIENTHAMNPGTLKTLCELVTIKVREASALRLVLASDRSMAAMMRAPALSCMSQRMTGSFVLKPLTAGETAQYLRDKLKAGGCPAPETVLPPAICEELHAASHGWPGIVDRLVLLAFAKASRCPIQAGDIERPSLPDDLPTLLDSRDYEAGADEEDAPTIYVTYNGQTLHEVRLTKPRLLIGRSEHNDLRISSRFISRHHALFVRHGRSTFLMDLNSTNGTFVNSRRISNLMMKNDDVVLLGNHRIKFIDPSATERTPLDDAGFTETMVMKNLEDIRRLLARENIAAAEDSGENGEPPPAAQSRA
jgi:general secretion pathway protein A